MELPINIILNVPPYMYVITVEMWDPSGQVLVDGCWCTGNNSQYIL